METAKRTKITVQTTIQAPVQKVWELWTSPEHIKQWNSASEDWHTPFSENDLRVGGKFTSRMEARDGSFGFDFGGVYDEVILHKRIAYTLGDDRRVSIDFTENGGQTTVVETFDAEDTHSIEMQQGGWQAIMDNFKKYAEAH